MYEFVCTLTRDHVYACIWYVYSIISAGYLYNIQDAYICSVHANNIRQNNRQVHCITQFTSKFYNRC